MNCNPQSLMEQAKCFRCIPSGNVPSVISYLMCQWSNKPSGVMWTPTDSLTDWIDGSGAHTGDLPTFLATADMGTVSQLAFGPTVGHATIDTLTGLQTLPLLATLDLDGNQLTSLDLTGCTSLTYLDLANNVLLTAIDLRPATILSIFGANFSGLVTVNAQNLHSLSQFSVQNAALTTANLSGCNNLVLVNVSGNVGLASIDVSASISTLGSFDSSLTSITSLDFTNFLGLTSVLCVGSGVTSLIVDGCPVIDTIDASNNSLTSFTSVVLVNSLTYLDLSNNLLNSNPFDVTNNNNLLQLFLNDNDILDIRASNNGSLINFFAFNNNNLTIIDVTSCFSAIDFRFQNCLLPSTGFSGVDEILAEVNGAATGPGNLFLNGTGNGPPTADGADPNYVNLVTNLWNVLIN